MNWIIIALVVFALFFFLKYFVHHKTNLFVLRMLIVIVALLLITGYSFAKKSDVDTSSLSGKIKFVKAYVVWAGNSIKGFTKTTGDVITEVKKEFSTKTT